MLRSLLAALLFASFNITYCQVKVDDVVVITKSKSDRLWIRWAPTNPTIWKLGNKYGYNIERFTLLSDGSMENASGEKLNAKPVKPFDEDAFHLLSKEIKEAGVVSEILYGEGANALLSNVRGVLAQTNEQQNQFGIALLMCDLSLKVAEASGLFFEDLSAKKDQQYIYRVTLAWQPVELPVEPAVAVTRHTGEKPLAPISDLKIRSGDQTITLEWNSFLNTGIYTAYQIEKSEDGKRFTAISDMPYVHMTSAHDSDNSFFLDSLDSNNKSYYYRIRGISPFGETGPPSNMVSAKGKNNFSGMLSVQSGFVDVDNAIVLSWQFPAEHNQDIDGFVVCRATQSAGPYERITKSSVSKDQRTYRDTQPVHNGYYVIKAIDKDGREVASSLPYFVHREDNTPPAAPVALSGSISKNGIVQLSWAPNSDPDLQGYRVFRCNSTREEPVEMTKIILPSSTFTDTINVNVLNRKIHYYVVAVDESYNNSDYSRVLVLNRPDLFPPVAPVFVNTEVGSDTVNVRWQDSPSDDILSYELQRINLDNNVLQSIAKWSRSTPEQYSDTQLQPGGSYTYKLIVTDSAANTTESVSRKIFFEPGFRNSVSDINASVDRAKRIIKLEWKNGASATKCLIYRRKNDGQFMLYKTIAGNNENFVDGELVIGSRYGYKVQQVYERGLRSKLSEEIVVKF